MAAGETARKVTGPVYIELLISEDTARWIKAMTQNSLTNNEDSASRATREKLFDIIDSIL